MVKYNEIKHMSEEQFRRAKKRIRALCANFDGGNCLLLDDGDTCICPQIISYSLLCRYFRAAVLPADRVLHADIMGTDDRKKCASCGMLFYPRSNRALYCDRCAKNEERRHTRERVQRYRNGACHRGIKQRF